MRPDPILALVLALAVPASAAAQAPALQVSENRRFLVTTDGAPFFWLGDTAWELFHRLDREEAARYLDDRARKGFTVIQAVALAELDGLQTPNAYGHLPLEDLDPARPRVVDGPANDYWDHVDHVIREANARGLIVGLLPTWGDKWNRKWGVGPEIFTPATAEAYGVWLGRRYRDAGLVWIVGGDRMIESETQRAIVEAMARGLRQGDGGRHLISFHPQGGQGSAQYFHDADWLDFNMRQNGHQVQFDAGFQNTRVDYDRTPIKPVIDAEPIYEAHPVSFNAKERGHSIAADVRRPAYWNLFSGAFGHTYGHHSIWQMWQPGREPVNTPLMPWFEALDEPGSAQMRHVRRLMESRPFLSRIPDDSVIVEDAVPTSVPGAGRYRFVSTRDIDRTYAMVYVPAGRAFTVRLTAIDDPEVAAWWYDPRTGAATSIGTFPATGERRFVPPEPGEARDWVLVLDAVRSRYPPPGTPLPGPSQP